MRGAELGVWRGAGEPPPGMEIAVCVSNNML